MELSYLLLLSFMFLTVLEIHADLHPSEKYWQSVLPDTEMPKVLHDLLQPVDLKNGGYYLDRTPNSEATRPIVYGVSAYKVEDFLDQVYFFLEKDIHPGKEMKLQFDISNKANFLPYKLSNSIPFSSNKLPEILNRFSFKPGSDEAKIVMHTIKECEGASLDGTKTYCATSLESLIDYSISKVGKSVKVLSNEVDRENSIEVHTLKKGIQEIDGENGVVCHKENYVYAVYYCHESHSTRVYSIPMVSAKGTERKVVAICHHENRKWNSKHLAFQILKVKPGTVPICHFLAYDNVLWIPNA